VAVDLSCGVLLEPEVEIPRAADVVAAVGAAEDVHASHDGIVLGGFETALRASSAGGVGGRSTAGEESAR
jgi:hypothetical protein